MVIDIKMCRFEAAPWGFRLVGGSDYEYPLTVVKVTEGSIAEEAGLRVADVIVRVNETPTSPLTHDDADKLIRNCGNVFFFGIQRDDPEPENVPTHFPIVGADRPTTPESFLDVGSSSKSPISVAQSDEFRQAEYLPELEDRPCSVLSENTEIKLVEEEIAAVLSGESEVLGEHNVMGIFPKPGVCMSSDVLKTLNEEAIKTKAEKDKENRKWTTFLQKPDRPIPKSKQQLEAERRAANAYKVKIVKTAPKSPEREIPAAPALGTTETELEENKVSTPPKEQTPSEPEVEEPAPTDSEVPNLENAASEANCEDEMPQEVEKIDKEKEASPENKEAEDYENPLNELVEEEVEAAEEIKVAEPVTMPIVEKTEEELALERQLADVQKQLAALSTLPSTIQATLDAVTKQLAELVPTFKLQKQPPASPTQKLETETREISLQKIDEIPEDVKHDKNDVAVNNEKTEEQHCSNDNINNDDDAASDGNEGMENKHEYKNERDKNDLELKSVNLVRKQGILHEKSETQLMEDEQNLKKQKRNDVIEELEEHLERKNNPKRSKRAFGPLTPSSERPLVLPGGRRWYRPKDAYNDEFIAETLSAQAELITGSTLGVNFMKYQKPEKRVDLNRSEVYKVIHHLDRQPVRGIEVRPPIVPAAVDIRTAVDA